MRASYLRRGVLLALTLGAAACTEPSATPTTPSLTTLSPIVNPAPQVGGLYSGVTTLTSVSGGAGAQSSAGGADCVQTAFTSVLNQSDTMSMSLTQDATTGAVTARITASGLDPLVSGTGLSCTYKGTLGSSNGIILDAEAGSCTGANLIMRCQPDPTTGVAPVRQLQLVSSSLAATFDGWPLKVTSLGGREAVTYNVLDAQGDPVAGFVANHDFALTRR